VKTEYLDFTENDDDIYTDLTASPGADPAAPRQGYFGVDGAKKRRVDGQVDVRLARDNLLVAGAVFEDWDLKTGPLAGVSRVVLPKSDTSLVIVRDDRYLRFRKYGAFAQDQLTLWRRIDLTLGVRADGHSSLGGFVSPRVGIVSRVWRGGSLRWLYSRAYREPNVFELSSTPPVTSASAQITAIEVGLRQKLGALVLGTSGFVDHVTDAILPNRRGPEVGETGTSAFVRATAHSYGLEQTMRVGSGPWEAFGSYAYVTRERQRVTASSTGVLDVAHHKVIAGASYALFGKKAFVSLYNVFNSGAQVAVIRVDALGTEILSLPDYENVTATIGMRDVEIGGTKLQGTLTFDNVFDTQNMKPNYRGNEPRAYPQNRFNVLASLWIAL
jgi:outer membrane receptor protein involved in Fe transport